MICNATKQELKSAGLSILGSCTVEGCGLPVARHRDEAQPVQEGNKLYHPIDFYDELVSANEGQFIRSRIETLVFI